MKNATLTEAQGRQKWNICMFIISFTISNLISGIIYDTYVNYLQEVSLSVATSFWAYYGYATFISAALLLFIPKTGYKSLLVFCAATCSAALLAVILLDVPAVFYAGTLLALVGLQLHYAILSPFVAAYTNQNDKIKWYSRAYYIGYVGYFFSTYLGGVFTVKLFASHLGATYQEAKALTQYVEELSGPVRAAYLQGNKDVLLAAGLLSAAAVLPVLLIRQKSEDYQVKNNQNSFRETVKEALRAITGRHAVVYLLYWALINFGMGLFTSYYTVFLNRNLHIDKATSSLLVSISYIALVIFLMFTPLAVKRFGQVVTLGGSALMSIPFMLLIANGDRFGSYTVPVVGTALFLRSGLVNLGYPVDSSLSMELVRKDLRPAYASAVNVTASVASIASGHFTGAWLFASQEGYRTAYYIAAAIYTVACVILLAGLMKFNRTSGQEEG